MTRPVQSLCLAALTTFVASTPVMAESSSSPSPKASFSTPLPALNEPNKPNFANINQADYILGPGDQLQLSMYGQTELFATPYGVLVDGSISLPFVGRVPVAGKTIREAEIRVSELYKRYFKRPFLTMVLVKPRQLTLAVAGEVVKPGTYPFLATEQIPTVSQLLKLAGGVTPSANLRTIEVRRSKFDQPGVFQPISINLMKLIQEGDITQDIRLRDGDIVVVQAAEKPSLEDFTAAINSSFASDNTEPLNVAVVGEVFRPGPYVIQAGNSVIGAAGTQGSPSGGGNNARSLPTVSQAIQVAGGIKPEANVRNVQLRRVSRAGAEQLLTVDLWKLVIEGDIRQDIPLQRGDTVIVSKSAVPLTPEEQQILADITLSPATIDVNVVGEVIRPGTVKIKPNTPLNTAVLAAGGFDNRRANKNAVKLIRLNPDGTVTERKIKLAFDAPVSEENNPPLRNNDVVVVGRSGLASFADTAGSILNPLGSFSILRSLFGGGIF
jgi:polysaccharide export outer membrane protein